MNKIMVFSTNQIINNRIKRIVYEDVIFNTKKVNVNVIKRYINQEKPKLIIIHHSIDCLNLSGILDYLVTNKIIPVIYISNKSGYASFYNLVEDVYFTYIKEANMINILPRIIPIFIKIRNEITRLNEQISILNTKVANQDILYKAKMKLIEDKNLTEEEAHKYIIKQAMDQRLTKEKIAQMILKQEI